MAIGRPAAHRADPPDRLADGRDERLPAEPGIDAHHQDHVDEVEDGLDDGRRRTRVQRDAGPLAERPDGLERAVQVRPGFGMDRDDVRAGRREGGEVGVGRRDHQVHVEGLRRERPQRLHDVGAERDVRDEVPVHHVEMDPVGARRLDRGDLLAQRPKSADRMEGAIRVSRVMKFSGALGPRLTQALQRHNVPSPRARGAPVRPRPAGAPAPTSPS